MSVVTPQEKAPSHHLPPAVRGEANSAQNFPDFEPPGPSPEGWGIDKLVFSIPISGDVHHDISWGHRKHKRQGDSFEWSSRWIELPLASGISGLLEVYNVRGQPWSSIEFNPARMVDPHGAGLCAVADLPSTVGLAWQAAGEFVTPLCQLAEAKIRRVDVARDFVEVGDFSTYVDAWRGISAPHSKRLTVEHDPQTGLPQTIYRGSKAGGWVRVYDKFAQSPGLVPSGTVRFEVEARKGWCKTAEITQIEDVSSETVWELLVDRFDWSGCAAPVLGCSELVARLEKVTDRKGAPLSEVMKDAFMGHLLRGAIGVAGDLPNERKAAYNRYLRELGVTPQQVLTSFGDRPAVRLDLSTGREVGSSAEPDGEAWRPGCN